MHRKILKHENELGIMTVLLSKKMDDGDILVVFKMMIEITHVKRGIDGNVSTMELRNGAEIMEMVL
jgi:methionyl-tRNA formyltransferase